MRSKRRSSMAMKKELTKEEAARIEKLRAALNRHRYEYHVLDRPTMDDEAFDSLKHELKQTAQFTFR